MTKIQVNVKTSEVAWIWIEHVILENRNTTEEITA